MSPESFPFVGLVSGSLSIILLCCECLKCNSWAGARVPRFVILHSNSCYALMTHDCFMNQSQDTSVSHVSKELCEQVWKCVLQLAVLWVGMTCDSIASSSCPLDALPVLSISRKLHCLPAVTHVHFFYSSAHSLSAPLVLTLHYIRCLVWFRFVCFIYAYRNELIADALAQRWRSYTLHLISLATYW